ncbi:MAG: cell division protein FtsQ [Rhodobacteraceae bacterium]|nr:cell division protein FtsQ [Paracoccaceae bacterium]
MAGGGRVVQSVRPASHDPAPTRFQFRVQRWLLTPGIRFLLKAGIPTLVVLGTAGVFLASPTRRADIVALYTQTRSAIEERPEFMVNLMAIDGAGDNLADDIRDMVPIEFPVSSFDLDLTEIRDEIEALDPVRSATGRIRPGGILQVDVTERVPVVVWRNREGLDLLDAEGVYVETLAARADRPDLPLIAGEGAEDHVGEAIQILMAADKLADRVRGIVRMGERRWDVLLDRNQRIMLPTENPVQALERVIALSEAQDLLARDVVVVDMRIAARPTLRMSENAQQDWWQIRHLDKN